MKDLGEYRPTEYPYRRIEGSVREEFLRRFNQDETNDEGHFFTVGMELSERTGHGGSPEHETYVRAFLEGFLGTRRSHPYYYAPMVDGEPPCRDANRHQQNGYINGENTRREIVS